VTWERQRERERERKGRREEERERYTSYVLAFRDELTKKEGAHTRLSLPARTTSNALLKKAKGDEGTMGPDVDEERESLRAIVCRPRC